MDGRPVGDPAHLTAQGVDLLDELALGEAADRGIAGHERNGIEVDIEQERLAAHPRRRQRRLAARMTASDDDDVIFFCHAHRSFRTVLHHFHFPPFREGSSEDALPGHAQVSWKPLQFFR